MVAKAIRGQGTAFTPGTGAGGAILTSRFIVDPAGPHQTPEMSESGLTPIIWDPTPDWDDIGFPDDFSTPGLGGFFFAEAGDYLVTASAELDPTTAYNQGQFMLSIETGTSAAETYATTPCNADNFSQLSISTIIRAPAGGFAWDVKIWVHTSNIDDTSFVQKAVVTFAKLN